MAQLELLDPPELDPPEVEPLLPAAEAPEPVEPFESEPEVEAEPEELLEPDELVEPVEDPVDERLSLR